MIQLMGTTETFLQEAFFKKDMIYHDLIPSTWRHPAPLRRPVMGSRVVAGQWCASSVSLAWPMPTTW